MNIKHESCDGLYFKEVYFLPDGEKYWIYEGWTKGYLLIHYGGDSPILSYRYEIDKIEEDFYMFITIDDLKNGIVYVLKKVSSKRYSKNRIGRRENINKEFVCDERILGEWIPVGFVDKIDEFDPDYSDCIWLQKVNFYENGIAERIYFDGEVFSDNWTEGYLLDKEKSVADKYTICNIGDKEYLFLEWKMGNYVYGGLEPSFYVFERK